MELIELFEVIGAFSGLVALVLTVITLQSTNRLTGRIMDIQREESSKNNDLVSDLRSTKDQLIRMLENQLPRSGAVQ